MCTRLLFFVGLLCVSINLNSQTPNHRVRLSTNGIRTLTASANGYAFKVYSNYDNTPLLAARTVRFKTPLNKRNYTDYTVHVKYDQESYDTDLNQINSELSALQNRILDVSVGLIKDHYDLLVPEKEKELQAQLAFVLFFSETAVAVSEGTLHEFIKEKVEEGILKAIGLEPWVKLFRAISAAFDLYDMNNRLNILYARRNYVNSMGGENHQWSIDVSEYIRRLFYYELSVEGGIPLTNKYEYNNSKDVTYGSRNLIQPYSIRIVNFWRKHPSKYSGFYIPLGFHQSPFMFSNAATDTVFQSGKIGSFNHIDALMGYSGRLIGRNIGLNINIELGARANFINRHEYTVAENKVSSISPLERFSYDQTNLIFNIGAAIDFKYVRIIARHSHTLGGIKDNGKGRRLDAKGFQIALQIPIYKSFRYL